MTVKRVVSLLVFSLPTTLLAAEETVDGVPCIGCNFPKGWLLESELGTGYVSGGNFKFGDYSGLTDEGAFLVGNIVADYWGDSENHWRFAGRSLGLGSRFLSVEGGRPGSYDLHISYSELPHTLFETGATPFTNLGSTRLTLPAEWVSGASTDNLPFLDQALQPVNIRSDRETFGLALNVVPNARLAVNASYRIDSKSGRGILGGSFLNSSTLLPRSIDYETQILEAAMSYRGEAWSARVSYYGSLFRNAAPVLRWDNPFTPVVSGASIGQSALEPDNDFHQFTLSGQFRPKTHTQLSASLAVGRMTQDDRLLPFTLNPALQLPLPATSLNGKIDTLRAALRLSSRPTRKLRLRGSYTVDERNNDTPSLEWAYVAGDSLPAASRLNLPYGYDRDKISLSGDYRLPLRIRASGGWKRDVYRRDFSEVDRTAEHEWWATLKFRAGDRADLSVQYAFADRNISDYRAVPATVPQQNPLLRKYNLADRKRRGAEVGLSLRPTDFVELSLVAERSQDDYNDSPVGLISADYDAVYADASFMLPANLQTTAHAGYERYASAQLGSQSFSLPDWRADNTDKSRFAGLRIDAPKWFDRIHISASYTFSDTKGFIRTTAAGSRDAFPNLSTRLHGVELNVDYQWRERTSLRLGWLYEDYSVDDWTLENVDEDTLPRVLSLGNRWLGYSVNVIALSFTYGPGQVK